jgi:NADPH-dependent glutamate synthase beta subunit-like oxidoreductase
MQGLKELADDDVDAQRFLSEGFDDILEALSREMPFPITYSWICLRTSKDETNDSPFSTMILNAFKRILYSPTPQRDLPWTNARNVAVIGSGPAGLTAAWELAMKGFAVTVFERRQELGGMLRTGIPSYRLPKGITDAEIDRIRALGVQMKPDTPVDQGFFEGLLKSGEYAAIFIAAGARASRRLRIDGDNLQGVVTALDFLREYNLTGSAKVGKSVIVIGGGNVATDAAGVAKRCGAEAVRLFCLEDRG